jgi:hypothetical protein
MILCRTAREEESCDCYKNFYYFQIFKLPHFQILIDMMLSVITLYNSLISE